MTEKKSYNSENPLEHYTEFWSEALQQIDTLHNLLYAEIEELEKLYSSFEAAYGTITDLTQEMVSLYAGFNTLQGHEDLMKLKTLLNRYEQNYTRKGIDFDLIHFLLNKVNTLRDESFNNFPAVEHIETDDENKHKAGFFATEGGTSYLNRPFKWITFLRNSSWFMVPFHSLDIIDNQDDFSVQKHSNIGFFSVQSGDGSFLYRELLPPLDASPPIPRFFICIDGKYYYPADKISKKIFAHNDFVNEKIEQFESPHDKPFHGRIKIFGINHIFLKQ